MDARAAELASRVRSRVAAHFLSFVLPIIMTIKPLLANIVILVNITPNYFIIIIIIKVVVVLFNP